MEQMEGQRTEGKMVRSEWWGWFRYLPIDIELCSSCADNREREENLFQLIRNGMPVRDRERANLMHFFGQLLDFIFSLFLLIFYKSNIYLICWFKSDYIILHLVGGLFTRSATPRHNYSRTNSGWISNKKFLFLFLWFLFHYFPLSLCTYFW